MKFKLNIKNTYIRDAIWFLAFRKHKKKPKK